MIRVTTSQLHRSAFRTVNDTRLRTQEAQEVAMTGRRVNTASDDPAAAARARIMGELKSTAKSHQTSTTYGIARLQTAEDALAEVSNQILRAQEIALSSANETLTGEQRLAYATEVRQIHETVADLINTRHLGEYVFAHVNTNAQVFDSTTGNFTYDVNTYAEVRRAEVGQGQYADIGASASHAFAARTADPRSVDVPAMLAGLEAALVANDPDAIRGTIDSVQSGYDQVVGERTRVGVRVQRLRDAEAAAEQSVTVYTSLESDLVDADAAEAFSNLSMAENSMQAAVTVAARILGPSLLDVL